MVGFVFFFYCTLKYCSIRYIVRMMKLSYARIFISLVADFFKIFPFLKSVCSFNANDALFLH